MRVPACQCAAVLSEAVAEPLREVLESQDVVQSCSHELELPCGPGAELPELQWPVGALLAPSLLTQQGHQVPTRGLKT